MASQPDHTINLRRMLLESVGFAVDGELSDVAKAKASLSYEAPDLFILDYNENVTLHSERSSWPTWFSHASRAAKAELGKWIRQRVGMFTTKGDP